MSRYTGPTTKINRRFGMPIFAETKAMKKKPYIPGQHGPRLRRRVTDYSMGLCEKQKLRYMFGLSEKQFRLTFERAKRQRGVTGEIFMRLLELRLDNIIYQLGFARSRAAARQFVNHGHVQVNGKKVQGKTALLGRAGAENIALCLALCIELGLSEEELARGTRSN